MRVGLGAVVLVLIMALVSLGFLFSDNIDTHQELKAANQVTTQAQQENQNLREQLNIVAKDNETLNIRNAELEQQILAWQEQFRRLEEQQQILEKQKSVVDQQNQTLENENAVLKEQLSSLQSPETIDAGQLEKVVNPLGFPLLVPFLPVAVAATYVVARQRTRNSIQTNQGTRLNNVQRGNMVKLSDDEMKAVIKMRRGQ